MKEYGVISFGRGKLLRGGVPLKLNANKKGEMQVAFHDGSKMLVVVKRTWHGKVRSARIRYASRYKTGKSGKLEWTRDKWVLGKHACRVAVG